ncbi:hypothetical protein [Novosphingobium sp. 11B]
MKRQIFARIQLLLKRGRSRVQAKRPDAPELVVNSGLTDKEISQMAERLRIRHPELHRILSHPDEMDSSESTDFSMNLFERASVGVSRYVREFEKTSCRGGISGVSKVQQHLIYYIAGWNYRISPND